jgi:hypothetical protein
MLSPLCQLILALLTLQVVLDLIRGRLAHVDHRQFLAMQIEDLGMGIG